ncbi:phage tail fiber protein [Humitalea sp. 24SJ18S-53]|uniref:phage tail fiber protein n=1 Tax=Humitalea sp. 24SJ18S-53 TaxID=3422307 RepID=UPI003D67A9B0
MPALTDYARNLVARALVGRSPALPNVVFVGLGTSATAAAGLTGEPVANGYARAQATFTGTGAQRNAETLRFAFTAASGTLTHLGLFDAQSGGNAIAFAPLNASVVVAGAGTVTIAAEALVLDGT